MTMDILRLAEVWPGEIEKGEVSCGYTIIGLDEV